MVQLSQGKVSGMTFKAILVSKNGSDQQASIALLDDALLMDGDVTIAVDYSTVNYKDGLALTGKSPIIKTFPLVPGVLSWANALSGRALASARATGANMMLRRR